MHRSNGLVEIKHTSRLHGNEDFVLAQQCQQVYYTYPLGNKSSEWWTVIKTTARSRYNVDMGEFIEDANNVRSFDVDQSDEISQPCRVLLLQHLMIQIYLLNHLIMKKSGNMNWGNKDDEDEDDEEEDDGDGDGDGDGEEEEEDEDDCCCYSILDPTCWRRCIPFLNRV